MDGSKMIQIGTKTGLLTGLGGGIVADGREGTDVGANLR